MGDLVYVAESAAVDTLGTPGVLVPTGSINSFPIGGTSLAIANLELRFPSPYMPRRFRLAVFVDGGALGTENLWQLGQWRVTPGAGIRITTPVGPARLDLAYNPYPPDAGPLYANLQNTLVRLADNFRPSQGNFFSRLRINVALGQAF
jgi:hypothetical protein